MAESQIFEQMADVSQHLWEQYESAGADTAGDIASKLHIADLAVVLELLDKEQRAAIFACLQAPLAAEVLEEVEPDTRDEFFEAATDERLAAIVQHARDDDAVYFLDHMDESRAEILLGHMPDERHRELREQWQLPDDTAGHIMSRDVVTVRPTMTVNDIRDQLRRQDRRLEGYLYVADARQHLLGYLALKDFVISADDTQAIDIMSDATQKVSLEEDQEQVADIMQRYHLRAVPVVDAQGRLRGEITWDDAVDVVEAEAEEDMLAIAGTTEDPEENASSIKRAKQRLPYLIVTVLGGFVMAHLIHGSDEEMKNKFPMLLAFLPLVPALGGNIGIQSATVTVRSIATGDVTRERMWGRTIRELGTGILLSVALAVICGIGAMAMVHFTDGPVELAAVIAIAMLVAVLVAACFGVFIPIACQKFGIDPAIAAGPFITMLNDISGVGIYLAVASMLLSQLV